MLLHSIINWCLINDCGLDDIRLPASANSEGPELSMELRASKAES